MRTISDPEQVGGERSERRGSLPDLVVDQGPKTEKKEKKEASDPEADKRSTRWRSPTRKPKLLKRQSSADSTGGGGGGGDKWETSSIGSGAGLQTLSNETASTFEEKLRNIGNWTRQVSEEAEDPSSFRETNVDTGESKTAFRHPASVSRRSSSPSVSYLSYHNRQQQQQQPSDSDTRRPSADDPPRLPSPISATTTDNNNNNNLSIMTPPVSALAAASPRRRCVLRCLLSRTFIAPSGDKLPSRSSPPPPPTTTPNLRKSDRRRCACRRRAASPPPPPRP